MLVISFKRHAKIRKMYGKWCGRVVFELGIVVKIFVHTRIYWTRVHGTERHRWRNRATEIKMEVAERRRSGKRWKGEYGNRGMVSATTSQSSITPANAFAAVKTFHLIKKKREMRKILVKYFLLNCHILWIHA